MFVFVDAVVDDDGVLEVLELLLLLHISVAHVCNQANPPDLLIIR